jgi:hypothetical protein
MDWRTRGVRDVLDTVEGLGWKVNLYGVPDLESFLEATLAPRIDHGSPRLSPDGAGADGN